MTEDESTLLNLFNDKLEEAMKHVPNPTSVHPNGMQMWLNALQTGTDVQFRLSTAENGSLQITLVQPEPQNHRQESATQKLEVLEKESNESDANEQENQEDSKKTEEWGLFHNKGHIIAQPIKQSPTKNKFKWSFDGGEINLYADGNEDKYDLDVDKQTDNEKSVASQEDSDNDLDKPGEPTILVSITTEDSVDDSPSSRDQTEVKCADSNEERTVVDPSSFPCVREEWYIKLPLEPGNNLVDDACEVDTECVAFDMRNYLRCSSISLRNFSRNYLQRTQGTLSDLLNHPKPWQDLSTRGRAMYTKMMEFLNAENIREITEKLKEGYSSVRPGPTILTLPKELMQMLEGEEMPPDQLIDSLASNFQIEPEYLLDYCEEQIRKYAAENGKEEKSAPKEKKAKPQGRTLPPKQRKHICPETGCGIILGCRIALSTHMLTHTGSRPFKCSDCDKRFATISNKRSHERRHEKRTHRKVSKRAMLVASLRQQPKEPQEAKDPENFDEGKPDLSLCPSTKVKTDVLRYVCGVCTQRFISRPLLHEHITLNHTSAKMRDQNKVYTCHVCLRSMKTVAALVVHLRTHTGDRPFRCPSCQKTFGTKANLYRHLKSHTGEKPFECETCGARFTEASSVVTHMRTHTGEKPFECEICKKRFTQRGPLDAHRRIHSDLRPYLCEICGVSFRQKTNLRAHELRHAGERRFQCQNCPQKFQYRNDLTRHVLTHSGHRPHACSICPQTFTRAQYLREHIQRAHDLNSFHCENCGLGWANRAALERHRPVCPVILVSSVQKCDSCGLEFDSAASFESHQASCGSQDTADDQNKSSGNNKLVTLTASEESNMEYTPSMLQVVPVDKIISDGVLSEGKTYLLSAIPSESVDNSLTNPMCCIAPLSPGDAVSGMDVTPSMSSAMSTETDPSLSATSVASSFAMTSGESMPIHVAIMNNIDPSLLDGSQVLGEQQDEGRLPYITKIALHGNPGEGETCSIDPSMQSLIIAEEEGDDVGTGTRYVVVSVSDDVTVYNTDTA